MTLQWHLPTAGGLHSHLHLQPTHFWAGHHRGEAPPGGRHGTWLRGRSVIHLGSQRPLYFCVLLEWPSRSISCNKSLMELLWDYSDESVVHWCISKLKNNQSYIKWQGCDLIFILHSYSVVFFFFLLWVPQLQTHKKNIYAFVLKKNKIISFSYSYNTPTEKNTPKISCWGNHFCVITFFGNFSRSSFSLSSNFHSTL